MVNRKKLAEKILCGENSYTMPFPGVPLLELAGDCRMMIENHQGVLSYSDKEICICIRNGIYKVDGNNLSLSYMSRCQLVITGRIDSISVERRPSY